MGVSNTHLYTRVNYYSGYNVDSNGYFDAPFLSISFFCMIISLVILLNLKKVNENNPQNGDTIAETERCVFDQLRDIKLKNPKRVTMGHLNINSLPNKFDGIMDMVGKNLDIFLISETKIDFSFPDAQFSYEGYSKPHRKDRSLGGGGLLMYVNENIPSRKLNKHTLPPDVEIM